MNKRLITLIIILGLILITTSVFFYNQILRNNLPARQDMIWGATFSQKYAEKLGLNWKKVFLAILDELQIKILRIPVYWDQIQPSQENFNFSDLDWMINEIQKREGKIILAIGRKLPRWPECHEPEWIQNKKEFEKREFILPMLRTVVERYKNNPSIIAWQVENEPLFLFGECPLPSRNFLKKEVGFVRKLDSERPIIITDSGELSTWIRTAPLADTLGISLYRVSFNKFFGYWYYPLKPSFYKDKKTAIKALVDDVIITEMQAEPWVETTILETPLSIQYQSMNEFLLENNFDFVSRTQIQTSLIWGVEWWYWMREQGDSKIWEKGKEMIKKYNQNN